MTPKDHLTNVSNMVYAMLSKTSLMISNPNLTDIPNVATSEKTDPTRRNTPRKVNSLNLKMMVWKIVFSLARGVFSCSMLIFLCVLQIYDK